MKTKFFTILFFVVSSVLLFTGCGENNNKNKYVISQSGSGQSGKAGSSGSSSANMDYMPSNIILELDGEYIDYSYTFDASGYTNDKKVSEGMHELVKTYVNEKEGFIDKFNDSFYIFEKDELSKKNRSYNYKSYGTMLISVEVKNEYAKELIELLENYCKDNDLNITTFDQSAKNYQNYEMIPDSDYYVNKSYEIEKKELERRLKYTTIRISLNYGSKRGIFSKLLINIKETFTSFFNEFGEMIKFVVEFIIVGFTIVFVVSNGYGIFMKSSYKKKRKHPEWFAPKQITVSYAKEEENNSIKEVEIVDNISDSTNKDRKENKKVKEK